MKKAAPQDQRRVLDLAAAYAERHPETKAYLGQLIDQTYRGTTQTVNAIDRLRQEHALESERTHREAQLRNGGARSARDKALAAARALAMDGSAAAAQELARPDLPLGQVPVRLQEINEQLAQIQAERQINLFLDDRLNSNNQGDGVLNFFRQAGIDTADQTHVLLLTALGPAGGVGAIEAMSARTADRLKAAHPHMSTDTARVLSVGMSTGQFFLGKLEFLKVLNRLPGTKRLLEHAGKLPYWRQLAARESINLFGVTATNELSLLIDSFGQEVANAITGDIENGHEPGSFLETQKHVLALSGMLGLGGIGGRLTRKVASLLGPKISKAVSGIVRQVLSRLSSGEKTLHEETSGGRPIPDHEPGMAISHEEGEDSSKPKGAWANFWNDRAVESDLRKYPPVKALHRSDPISGSLDISRVDRRTALVFQRIFPALDKVLNGRGFPKIFVDNNVLGDPKGQFRYIEYKKREGDKFVPTSIGIKPNGPWLHMTGLHETAHPIDMTMLGKGLGYASDMSPDFAVWRKLVDATPTIRDMRLDEATYKKFLPYHEIFARSFAQYVAMRTGDKVLFREIETIRRHPREDFKVWPDQEFWPIAAELDRIFESRGLK